jgi:hypothetical protein
LLAQHGFYRHLYLSQFKGQPTDSLLPPAGPSALSLRDAP